MTLTSAADPIATLIVGESPAIRRLRALIARLGPTTLPVLVQGPTGAGKELVARALHVASRRTGRLVAFNVCAVADTMFEDALFGHVKGAFTGAAGDSPGFLAEANGGTMFLDEIGELPLGPQAKLLRVLETHEFRPVGARYDRRSDFRVVAATNRQLPELSGSGRFRLDLLHRLSGFVLSLPPLVDRTEDIPLLVRRVLAEMTGGAGGEMSPSALALLQRQPWPGNVRELRHVVERAAILAGSRIVGRDAIQEALDVARMRSDDVVREPEVRSPHSGSRVGFARRRLLDLLERCDWDTARAAAELGVHRATIYRRMKRLSIETWRADIAPPANEKRPSAADPACRAEQPGAFKYRLSLTDTSRLELT